MINWNDVVPALEELYTLKGARESLDDDLPYLEEVFSYTEELWHKNFEQLSDVRFVLLGEAPVLDNYIYDDTTSLTVFFRHRLNPRVESVPLSDKARLLPMLRESGFLVVDIFPFAFGKRTEVQYPGQMNAAFEIAFESLLQTYLLPKLELIRCKTIPSVQFAWRYKKHVSLNDLLVSHLLDGQLISSRNQLSCVGSSNMWLDEGALEELFSKVRKSEWKNEFDYDSGQESDWKCPFCTMDEERVVQTQPHCFTVRDGYPISPGHTLVIARRHVGSFFELTREERASIFDMLQMEKERLDREYAPSAYNIGINDGEAAGQTVPHLHVHLIPRYEGDVADPRGGVRWIFLDKAAYWNERG